MAIEEAKLKLTDESERDLGIRKSGNKLKNKKNYRMEAVRQKTNKAEGRKFELCIFTHM